MNQYLIVVIRTFGHKSSAKQNKTKQKGIKHTNIFNSIQFLPLDLNSYLIQDEM